MKKTVTLSMIMLLLLLCGCSGEEKPTKEKAEATRFLFDTVVSISANCGDEMLDGAFVLCKELEKTLSRTVKSSDVYKINNSEGIVTVSDDTAEIIRRGLMYSHMTAGKFDITVYPLTSIWDFKNEIIPSKDEIAAALKNVDYEGVEIYENGVSAAGRKIDLGALAKGYAADRVAEYFKNGGIEKALINLGGNIATIGEYTIGIEKPFEDKVMLNVDIKNKSVVTSGIYERYIKKDGKIYHHILDPDTGYGVENELYSVTVMGESSLDCDALSTVCMLLGIEEGLRLINTIPNVEAVFIDNKYNVTLSDGLYRIDDKINFKEVTK